LENYELVKYLFLIPAIHDFVHREKNMLSFSTRQFSNRRLKMGCGIFL